MFDDPAQAKQVPGGLSDPRNHRQVPDLSRSPVPDDPHGDETRSGRRYSGDQRPHRRHSEGPEPSQGRQRPRAHYFLLGRRQ